MIRALITYIIECDRCGDPSGQAESTSRNAALDAVQLGWTETGQRWLCPACQEAESRRPPAEIDLAELAKEGQRPWSAAEILAREG